MKKKRISFIWIIVVFVLLLSVAGIIYYFNFSKEDNEIKSTLYEELTYEYNNNSISTEDFAKQIYYAFFEDENVNKKYDYDSIGIDIGSFVKFLAENKNSINEETLAKMLNKIYLNDVIFETQESSKDYSSNFFSFNSVYASPGQKLRTLDSVKLSKNGRFLLWYTTSGSNKVSEQKVEKIANSMEDIVDRIENFTGVKYNYEPDIDFDILGIKDSQKFGQKLFLEKNNIASSYLESAMSIYIVDPGVVSETTMAYYLMNFNLLEEGFIDLATILGGKDAIDDYSRVSSTLFLPCFVILPKSFDNYEDLELVCAHEITHHFQCYISGEGKYKNTKSGLFTDETISNYVSSSIIDAKNPKNVMANYARGYVLRCDETLNTIGGGSGYPNLTFGKAYEEVVSDGKNKFLKSSSYKEPLQFLYESANGKFKDVFDTLAVKNVTNDDEKICFNSTSLPKNRADLEKEYNHSDTVLPLAMHYYYFIKRTVDDFSSIDINKENGTIDVVVIGKKNKKYSEITRITVENGVRVDLNKYFDDGYDEVVIGIVNSDLSFSSSYSIQREKVILTDNQNYFKYIDSIEFKVQDIFDFIKQIVDAFLKLVNSFDEEGLLEEDKQEVSILNENADELVKNMDSTLNDNNKNIRLVEYHAACLDDSIHDEIMDKYLVNKFIKIVDMDLKFCRYSIGININRLNKIPDMYLLITSEEFNNECILITSNVE